jgi:hypothetical protein
MQDLLKVNPDLAARLGVTAAPAPAPVYATVDQVQALIDARLKAAPDPLLARVQLLTAQAEGLLQRALPAADFAAFQQYLAGGAPGFDALLKTEALHPLAQLLWEIIKESKK